MPANKRNGVQKAAKFLVPTRWKLLALVLLYFSNYVSFLGLLLNFPIYYLFYWGKALTHLESAVAFAVHVAYLYVISCAVVRLLR